MATREEIEAAARAIAWLDPYGAPANVMDAAKDALEAAEQVRQVGGTIMRATSVRDGAAAATPSPERQRAGS